MLTRFYVFKGIVGKKTQKKTLLFLPPSPKILAHLILYILEDLMNPVAQ